MSRNGPLDLQGMPLDTRTIPQDRLNINNKERRNLFPWNGQFSPQLVETLLQTYAKAVDHILDPFLGSGTVLHEAGRCGFAAFGAEINPAAFKMASMYRFINVKPAKRREVVRNVVDLLNDLTPNAEPLFATSQVCDPRPFHEMIASRTAIVSDPHVKLLLEALIVLLNVGERGLDQHAIDTTWRKIREIVTTLPFSEHAIDLGNCDARELPLSNGRANLVITSPPYINVFNYHQQYRKSAELMGCDLLEVAKSEIGSNRKHRGNRFLTVTQYCLDMLAVFEELRRVCKSEARIIIIVGRESNVRKTRFFNGEIVASLAVRCAGFRFIARQERVFQNRFGEMIYEDILHFTPLVSVGLPLITPTNLARELLTAAIARVPPESESDLREALDQVDKIAPSPRYRPDTDQAAFPTRCVF